MFIIFVTFFLYKNRANLKREMKIIFLYKAQWGVDLINYIGDRYRWILGKLRYVIIGLGYILMAGILYLIGRTVYLYVTQPVLVTKLVKAPPIAPLIPYFPQLFGMDDFFPPFYFAYFIIALAIVAIVHEFSHGIYMRYSKVGIKSTGIVFLGPFLGAFVEQKESDMVKASKINQLSILGAGVFANTITAILFLFIWMGVFYMAFTPAGVFFNAYSSELVNIDSITSINEIELQNPDKSVLMNLLEQGRINDEIVLGSNGYSINVSEIMINGKKYYSNQRILDAPLAFNGDKLLLYEDSPALNNRMVGVIKSVNDEEVKNYAELGNVLGKYSAGEEIKIITDYNGEMLEYNLVLDENGLIGVGYSPAQKNMAEGIATMIFKEPGTHYDVKNDFLLFIYYLMFWIFIINLLVALFNMLPVSILDGGRFFYLTIWGITRSEKAAKRVNAWIGRIILFGVLLMMISWMFGISQ